MSRPSEDWEVLIDTFFDPKPSADDKTAVIQFFTKAHMAKPQDAFGSLEADYKEGVDGVKWPDGIRQKGLVRRIFAVLSGLAGMGGAETPSLHGFPPTPRMPTTPQQSLAPEQEAHLRLIGTEPAGVALAAALMSGAASVVVADELGKNHNFIGLYHGSKAPKQLWQLLANHTKLARQAARKPFLYVDLTTVLPKHLPADTTVGKGTGSSSSDDLRHVGNAHAATMQQQYQVLKKAFGLKRWFRFPHQWLSAFLLYMPPALAAGHWTLAQLISYLMVILRSQEDSRVAGRSRHEGILYDVLFRQMAEERLEREDTDFNLDTAVQIIDKELLAQVRSRLAAVLQEAGLSHKLADPDSRDLTLPAEAAVARKGEAAADLAEDRARAAETRIKLHAKLETQKHKALENSQTHGMSNTQLRKMIWDGRVEGWKQERQAKRTLEDDDEDDRPPIKRKGGGRGRGGRGKGGKGGRGGRRR